MAKFSLTDQFLDKYKTQSPRFGFNGLGELVYRRTYSRLLPDGRNERWWETVRRVVEAIYRIQHEWITSNGLEWNPWKAQLSAQEMYDRMFNLKFLPPGRGLWAAGSPITEERNLFMALYNCAMISTKTVDRNATRPFCFMMDALMCGTGVGFDTLGAGRVKISRPTEEEKVFTIPDSREGWVESLHHILDSYFTPDSPRIVFDYSLIRPAGEPIRGFGGISSGSGPLRDLHRRITELLDECVGNHLSVTNIMDIMNLIGKAVVAGNIRRSAQLALGPSTEEYLNLKNYEQNPERADWGWCSNNSIAAELGMDYTEPAKRTGDNGEPGYIWLENARRFGRMGDPEDNKDYDIVGFNPCVEIPLSDGETCNLCETFPNNHDSADDYIRTLKYAYLYAKTITLKPTHWPETNRAMLRNRRLGVSMSGIAQFLHDKGIRELRDFCVRGYEELKRLDEVYSAWLCVPTSRRLTTLKPSGTVSLLAGATPGVHFPESRFYIRRVRLAKNSPLVEPLRNAGYTIEDAADDPEYTCVVEIPVDVGDGVKTINDVSMWEQLELTAFIQQYWSDNGVSSTVTFKPEEKEQIPAALDFYQWKLKAISFLPKVDGGAYEQMPYEEIDETTYNRMVESIGEINFDTVVEAEDSLPEMYCTTDKCVVL